jgi:hypothetical protein
MRDRSRGKYARFGPFDATPNLRDSFQGGGCHEEIYDSNIGGSFFQTPCSDFDKSAHCEPGEGIIFRVDVPNGDYRFVASCGDAKFAHAHRLLVEDGGAGPPDSIGSDHVVLIQNFDQAQYPIGQAAGSSNSTFAEGKGVYARVGFDGRIPPPGDGKDPDPQFVDFGSTGLPSTDGPDSPVLKVTRGYIRVHQLQGNSSDGPGGPPNVGGGGGLNLLELWRVATGTEQESATADRR